MKTKLKSQDNPPHYHRGLWGRKPNPFA